jgi:hypothetical protein
MLYFALQFLTFLLPSCLAAFYVTKSCILASPSLLTAYTMAAIALGSAVWAVPDDEGYIYVVIFCALFVAVILRYRSGPTLWDMNVWGSIVTALTFGVGVIMIYISTTEEASSFNSNEGLRLDENDLSCVLFVTLSLVMNILARRNTRKVLRVRAPATETLHQYVAAPTTKVSLPIRPTANAFKYAQCNGGGGLDGIYGIYDTTNHDVARWEGGVNLVKSQAEEA